MAVSPISVVKVVDTSVAIIDTCCCVFIFVIGSLVVVGVVEASIVVICASVVDVDIGVLIVVSTASIVAIKSSVVVGVISPSNLVIEASVVADVDFSVV